MRGPVAGLSTARLARVATLLEEKYLAAGRLSGCQLLVARHGSIALNRSWGLMDRERGIPWAGNTIVRIYSMTKPIVAAALMMLWERGLFQLDDPVARVLPELEGLRVWVSGEGAAMQTEAPRRPVSFRHVLTHTAGFTYGAALQAVGIAGSVHPVDLAYRDSRIRDDAGEDLDGFIAKLGRLPLRYQPGERWMYSFATDVAGALVQRLSGQRLDRFLQHEVLTPLGMNDTGFHVRPENAGRFAACYAYRGDAAFALADDPLQSAYLREPVFFAGGGGLVSTAADYFRFCEMLRQGGALDGQRLLGSRTVALMTRNHLAGGASLADIALDGFSETTPVGIGFGLGVAVVADGLRAGLASQGDYYWGGAASTLFWIDPANQLVGIFLAQLMPSTAYPLRAEIRTMVTAALED